MLYSVEIKNHAGEELLIELSRPQDSGLLITDITGIGPGDAVLNINDFTTGDGGVYNSSRIPPRHILITLEFMNSGESSVEDNRHKMYRYFPLKKPITLTFETSNRTLEIEGYVETVEPVIFSEKTSAQIGIVCPDPYFQSEHTIDTWFYGEEPAFEFVFENKAPNRPTLEMGNIRNRSEETVIYDGESDVGVVIHINVSGPVGDITIHNTLTRESMHIDNKKIAKQTGSGLNSGDEVIINTKRGQKRVSLLRVGRTTNILNCVDRDSDWFTLTQGDNIFAFTSTEGREFLQFRVEHRVLYGGV